MPAVKPPRKKVSPRKPQLSTKEALELTMKRHKAAFEALSKR
ncbi:MAG TPA: hypothetical protein VH253_00345 [Phycisphaerae bacterium]|nr:hypothetical protein [Phycisphaerae bacterium]